MLYMLISGLLGGGCGVITSIWFYLFANSDPVVKRIYFKSPFLMQWLMMAMIQCSGSQMCVYGRLTSAVFPARGPLFTTLSYSQKLCPKLKPSEKAFLLCFPVLSLVFPHEAQETVLGTSLWCRYIYNQHLIMSTVLWQGDSLVCSNILLEKTARHISIIYNPYICMYIIYNIYVYVYI